MNYRPGRTVSTRTTPESGLDEPFERYCRTGEDADIVVKIGQPAGRLVFWRGQSYLPYWQTTAGRWSFPEIVPRRGDGEGSMPDRVNSYLARTNHLTSSLAACWFTGDTCRSLAAVTRTRASTRRSSSRSSFS